MACPVPLAEREGDGRRAFEEGRRGRGERGRCERSRERDGEDWELRQRRRDERVSRGEERGEKREERR
eukprot:scaffold69075_cov36-Tisochrysis_lutea.AAC.1